VQAADPEPSEKPEAPEPPPPASIRVDLKAIQPAWVGVYVDGEQTFTKLLDTDQTTTIDSAHQIRVRLGNDADVTPGAQLPDLGLAAPPRPDDGPVLIQVEYRVAPENVAAFLRAIHAIERTRRRNGADDWRVFRDIAEKDCFVERYIISSWAEYVRQRSRMTVTDRQLQERVAKLQQPEIEIRVSRLIGIDARDVAEAEGKDREAG